MFLFFFFKQKTAYEMLRSLVGSEMCIRDRHAESGWVRLYEVEGVHAVSPLAIIGAGGWGTALAITQARANRDVRLWVYEADLADSMNRDRENSIYLAGVKIPESVQIHHSMCDVVRDCDVVVIAVPSHFYRAV